MGSSIFVLFTITASLVQVHLVWGDCSAVQRDLVLLLDASGSVGQHNFQLSKDFIRNVLLQLPIGPDAVQASLLTFASKTKVFCWLEDSFSREAVLVKLDNVTYDQRATLTHVALRAVNDQVLTLERGDRPDVADMVVVITDGKSNGPTHTLKAVHVLHERGVAVAAIGVGGGVDRGEILAMASDPQLAFLVDSYADLAGLQQQLFASTCDEKFVLVKRTLESTPTSLASLPSTSTSTTSTVATTPSATTTTTTPVPTVATVATTATVSTTPASTATVLTAKSRESTSTSDCSAVQRDLVLLLDASGSVGQHNFQLSKDFIRNLLLQLPIGPDAVQASLLTFASKTKVFCWLEDSFSRDAVLVKLDNVTYDQRATLTHVALRAVNDQVLTLERGDRPDVADMVVVITDGKSNGPAHTLKAVHVLHERGVAVAAIGVGGGVDRGEILAMASDPQLAFLVDSYADLAGLQQRLFASTCDDTFVIMKTTKKVLPSSSFTSLVSHSADATSTPRAIISTSSIAPQSTTPTTISTSTPAPTSTVPTTTTPTTIPTTTTSKIPTTSSIEATKTLTTTTTTTAPSTTAFPTTPTITTTTTMSPFFRTAITPSTNNTTTPTTTTPTTTATPIITTPITATPTTTTSVTTTPVTTTPITTTTLTPTTTITTTATSTKTTTIPTAAKRTPSSTTMTSDEDLGRAGVTLGLEAKAGELRESFLMVAGVSALATGGAALATGLLAAAARKRQRQRRVINKPSTENGDVA